MAKFAILSASDEIARPLEGSRTQIVIEVSEVESSRTDFEVLGLGLQASSPRKLACPRLEDSTIF